MVVLRHIGICQGYAAEGVIPLYVYNRRYMWGLRRSLGTQCTWILLSISLVVRCRSPEVSYIVRPLEISAVISKIR